MIIVGLTGILGSGKSTVAAALRKRGLDVIDFDALAKESLNWKETQDDIREAFGDEYVVGGRVDVERLRQTVFTKDPNVRKLEAIIHPRVHEEVERRLIALEEKGVKAAIIEHPLLFEVGFHRPVDKIVVVTAKDDIIRGEVGKEGHEGRRRRTETLLSDTTEGKGRKSGLRHQQQWSGGSVGGADRFSRTRDNEVGGKRTCI